MFLHTSDLHIGKPFAGFESEQATRLKDSRLSAVARLAKAARDHGARHVLVAGDTFDSQGLADAQVSTALARFTHEKDIVWHVIPGNHDADIAGGIWERACRRGVPANVVVHRAPEPYEIVPGVLLLPSPLKGRAAATDPTLWMDAAPTPAGAVRIGLAHGSTQGFGSDRTASVEIDPRRAERAGLAYLALGDWHGTKEIGPATWYSGTPEPDQFADNNPGGALIVRVDAGGRATVDRVATAERRWLSLTIDVREADDVGQGTSVLDALDFARHDAVVALKLRGVVSLTVRAAIDDALARLETEVLHLRTDLDELMLAPAGTDYASLEDRQLRRAAEILAGQAEDVANPTSPVAAAALRRLFALVAAGGGA